MLKSISALLPNTGPLATIRVRLLMAVAVLTLATLLVGAIALFWLERADTRLESLHEETLTVVARSLDLVRRTSDLATTAPFLLNLRSSYMIVDEASELAEQFSAIEHLWENLPRQQNARLVPAPLVEKANPLLASLQSDVADLAAISGRLADADDRARLISGRLRVMERAIDQRITLQGDDDAVELRFLRLMQTIASTLIAANGSENLLGLGEYRRRYVQLSVRSKELAAARGDRREFQELVGLASGPEGLFALKHEALTQRLNANNMLRRIGNNTNDFNNMIATLVRAGEQEIHLNRMRAANFIQFAQVTIVVICLASVALALASAFYVSRYVARHIDTISVAMERLADGDYSAALPRASNRRDEIAKFLQSFRVFRANALRLDRLNRQHRQKTALLETTFDSISDGIAIADDSGRLETWNPQFADVLKLDKAALSRGLTLTHVLGLSEFRAQASSGNGEPTDFGNYAELGDGHGAVIETRRSDLPGGGSIWLFSNVTERKRIEERLRKIRHLESLGQLTGEVAHDFNNILTSIASNIHLLSGRSTGDERATQILERTASAVEIGMSLTQRLLAFSRKQVLAPETVELNELVSGIAELIAFSLGRDIKLETDYWPEELHVKIDPGQLESALLNLSLNSRHAIAGQGAVRFAVASTDGGEASLSVIDDGCGMSPEVLERALEPFFSTRRGAQGTGLGLSSVFGFIKQSGGDMQIESAPEKGTRVTLTLPLCTAGRTEQPSASSPHAGTVLLVEDDASTLARTSELLRKMGNDVVAVGTFGAASEYIEHGRYFDALVTDLQLDDGASGWDLARKSLDRTECRKIIVTSGGGRDVDVPDELAGRIVFAAKPLTANKVRRILNGPPFADAYDRQSGRRTSDERSA
ncbi:ATP-binding protein [Nitratireductor sp. XY-223]|uniref:ATP-binding protein n=1 Tax=Nitratireductor sp. XY-223 TaxID=2561926 RepID=UPI00145BCE23|nr:ATP-binding protein [Nitratireductor sp. XY-223]